MHSEFHRATRYPFAARTEVSDVHSEKLLTAFTSNLSLFGCYVLTGIPFPRGTKVSLRITRGGGTFAAYGKVIYSRPEYGMGIVFTEMEASSQSILEKWIASLRAK